MSDIDRLLDALFELDGERLLAIIREHAEDDSLGGIDSVLVPALEKMGVMWDQGDVALSQVYLAGKLCEEVADQLFPPDDPSSMRASPRIGLAVLDDYHLLGKRIVYSVLRASGYYVRDYGRQTVDGLIAAVESDGVELVLVSTLMLPSALRVKDFCERIGTKRKYVTVIVGGAPFRFDPNLWKEVGADGMAETASDTLAFVRNLSAGMKGVSE